MKEDVTGHTGREGSDPGAPTTGLHGLYDARILVVDDEEVHLRMLENVFRSAGITQLYSFVDPSEAIQQFLEVRPDLVFLDLHMPALEGLEVLAKFRSSFPERELMPVIVLTADDSSAARELALAAGANDFLSKPFDRAEVLLRVGNLLETRALYARVHHENAKLQAQIDAQEAEIRHVALKRRRRRARIRNILRTGSLHVEFQPIFALGTGEIVGFESLARFATSPERPPDQWFIEASEVGLGVELEIAAIDRAIEQLPALPAGTFISLNASPATAASKALSDRISKLPGERFVLELTEHARVDDYTTLTSVLAGFRAHGVRIAVDDTGAEYASLRRILYLHPDIIKLDVDLIRGIDTDPIRRALAICLVAFGAEIGAVLVAEGVEKDDELAVLRTLGVHWGQGFHLARPGLLPTLCPRLGEEPDPLDDA